MFKPYFLIKHSRVKKCTMAMPRVAIGAYILTLLMPMWRMRSCASTRKNSIITQVANVGKVEQKKKYANLLQFGICSKVGPWLILKPSKNYSNS